MNGAVSEAVRYAHPPLGEAGWQHRCAEAALLVAEAHRETPYLRDQLLLGVEVDELCGNPVVRAADRRADHGVDPSVAAL